MMNFTEDHDITELLHKWSGGDQHALTRLVPAIYFQLRRMASSYLNQERAGHTLQTTELVNELYLELAKRKGVSFRNRSQFLYFAGQVMRYILTGYARARLAQKRGGDRVKLPLDEKIGLSDGESIDLPTLVAMDEALRRLESTNPRQSRIIELRFFAGMNNGEVAQALGVSSMTVKREWKLARCRLSQELGKLNHSALSFE